MDSPNTADNIGTATKTKPAGIISESSKFEGAEKQDNTETPVTNESAQSNTTAETVAKIWAEQAQKYLSGGDYQTNVSPPQDTRTLKTRVEAFGLNNFKTFDNDNDGAIGIDDVKWAYTKPDKLAEQLLKANFNQIDSSGDGKIDRDELVAISQDKFKLGILPDTRIVDSSAPDVEAQKRALDLINQRVDQHPHKSESNYFDQSVKAMAKAVVTGDTKSFAAMVKNFSSTGDLNRIADAVNKLITPAGVQIRDEYGHLEVGREFGERVDFSPNDKPHSNSLNLSAEDAMKSLGKKIGENSGILKSQYSYEDKVEKRHEQVKELVKHVSTKLSEREGSILTSLMESADSGDHQHFGAVLTGMIESHPKSVDRVSKALNEISGGKDVTFNVFSWNRQTFIQARDSDGSKVATFMPHQRDPRSPGWVLKALNQASHPNDK